MSRAVTPHLVIEWVIENHKTWGSPTTNCHPASPPMERILGLLLKLVLLAKRTSKVHFPFGRLQLRVGLQVGADALHDQKLDAKGARTLADHLSALATEGCGKAVFRIPEKDGHETSSSPKCSLRFTPARSNPKERPEPVRPVSKARQSRNRYRRRPLALPKLDLGPRLTIEALREKMHAAYRASGLTLEDIGLLLHPDSDFPAQDMRSLMRRSTNPPLLTVELFAQAVGSTLIQMLDMQGGVRAEPCGQMTVADLRRRMRQAYLDSGRSLREIGLAMKAGSRNPAQRASCLMVQSDNPRVFSVERFARSVGLNLPLLLTKPV